MKLYHKIQTVYKRDERGKIIEGDYSLPEFEILKDIPWVFTEKVDGTNIRILWDGQSVNYGAKTEESQMPVFLLYKLQELFDGTANKQKFLKQFGGFNNGLTEVVLFGEGYGAKIQKGGENYGECSFVLFDVMVGDYYLQREDVEDVAKNLGIKVVPIIGEGTLDEAMAFVRAGFNSQWGEFRAEGIVARPKVELFTRKKERIITKIKHKDFLSTSPNKE